MLGLKQGQDGARITGLRPELVLAYLIISNIYEKYKQDCIITCGLDSKHSENSLHYVGCALDIRLPSDLSVVSKILTEIKIQLDDEFDIIIESNHYHIELQPKKGINL